MGVCVTRHAASLNLDQTASVASSALSRIRGSTLGLLVVTAAQIPNLPAQIPPSRVSHLPSYTSRLIPLLVTPSPP
jgi:hypothetical protein